MENEFWPVDETLSYLDDGNEEQYTNTYIEDVVQPEDGEENILKSDCFEHNGEYYINESSYLEDENDEQEVA